MITDHNITTIYYGPAEDMIAEVSALDCRDFDTNGFYVMACGADQYETDTFATLADARAYAIDYASHYAGVDVAAI
jgi:hypothetical protein